MANKPNQYKRYTFRVKIKLKGKKSLLFLTKAKDFKASKIEDQELDSIQFDLIGIRKAITSNLRLKLDESNKKFKK